MATPKEKADHIRKVNGFLVDFVCSRLDRTPGLEGLNDQLSERASICAAVLVEADITGEVVETFASIGADQIEDFADRRFVLAYPNEGFKERAKAKVSEGVWRELDGESYPVADDEWEDFGAIVQGAERPPLRGLTAYFRPRQE